MIVSLITITLSLALMLATVKGARKTSNEKQYRTFVWAHAAASIIMSTQALQLLFNWLMPEHAQMFAIAFGVVIAAVETALATTSGNIEIDKPRRYGVLGIIHRNKRIRDENQPRP